MEGFVFMKDKGFTILELMIIIAIMGILAVFYIPSLQDTFERSRSKNAEFNLLQIYSAQKRYLLSERVYYLCNSSVDLQDNVFGINQNLSIKIEDAYFDYDIRPEGTDGYQAMAIRKEGRCANSTMVITEDNSTVRKIIKRGCTW